MKNKGLDPRYKDKPGGKLERHPIFLNRIYFFKYEYINKRLGTKIELNKLYQQIIEGRKIILYKSD